MPNGDPRDGFFFPTLTLIIDSYILDHTHLLFFLYNKPAHGSLVRLAFSNSKGSPLILLLFLSTRKLFSLRCV